MPASMPLHGKFASYAARPTSSLPLPAARTGRAAADLVARGLSVRDVAALLGISPQRVSQLTARAS